jgi:hypothetical protein
MAETQSRWQIVGDYFENCSCDVACPCVFSPGPFLSAKPTQGVCQVAMAFHVDQGRYGEVTLDGLNAVVVARSPGGSGSPIVPTTIPPRWLLARG